MITEFKCQISQSAIDDLKFRIGQTRWTDEVMDSGWQYGANLSYIKELAHYWADQFDWKKVEKLIDIQTISQKLMELRFIFCI